MIKAVVIDDTEKARVALKSDLSAYCKNVTVVGEADGVASGVALLVELKPDLAFLDIRMGDGTGFDLLEKLKAYPQVKSKIIFTTAYDEYAIKAFKFSAIDYLLKPVDVDDLVAAVKKCNAQTPETHPLDFLLDSIKDLQAGAKRIALCSAEKIQIVSLSEIICCESQRNYTLFYLTEHRQILVTKTLKEYDEMLCDYGFVRVHHSNLINLKHLKEFVKIDGGYAIMSDKSQVPVSVRKRDDLLKALGVG